MSTGTQVDLTSPNAGFAGQAPTTVGAPDAPGSGGGAFLTDEEILGMPPVGQTLLSVPERAAKTSVGADNPLDVASQTPPLEGQAGVPVLLEMPQWMQAIAGDTQHGAEAQALWQEHQAFRAAFSSPAEARAIKEMFPGGVQEVQTLKQAAQSVDRIDAAIFSGDVRAQSEVVAELARANPAAFRSLFAEAAKVLATLPGNSPATANMTNATAPGRPFFRQDGQVAGPPSSAAAPEANHQPPATSHQSPTFDPVAYSNFERSTNETVARDVRSTIHDTLSRVLPEGVAEGAARRIGDDIFNEVHQALAADRSLSEQVGAALRASVAAGQGWRFGDAERQHVASLLAGRARQLVPSVARRVIGEWTGSVLGTARTKAARQAAAASRVDIGTPGGSRDSMPLRAMSSREVDYASMSDDEILAMK